MDVKEILGRLQIVSFEVDSISGTVSRSGEGNEWQTPGSIRYIDPALLRTWLSARQAAGRLCRMYGTKFLSGWAVPDVVVEPLCAKLAVIAQQCEASKQTLLTGWDEHISDWAKAHPEITPLSSRFPTMAQVNQRLGTRISVYRVNPDEVGSAAVAAVPAAADGVAGGVRGLAAQVLDEIAQDVSETWKPSATSATQKIKNLLVRIGDKARTLAFLGGNLGAVASFVDEAVHSLPPEGVIEGPDFIRLAAIMGVLSSPTRIVEGASFMDALKTHIEPVPVDSASVPEPTIEPAKTEPAQVEFAPASRRRGHPTAEVQAEPGSAEATPTQINPWATW